MIYMFLFDPKVQGHVYFFFKHFKGRKNMTYFTSPWNSWFQLGCHIFFPCVCTWVILQTLQSTLLDNWTDSWTLMLSLNCMNLVLVLQTYQSTLLDIYVINLQLSSKFCWELLRLFWQWSKAHIQYHRSLNTVGSIS